MSKGILVVDDSPAFRHVVRTYIDSDGDLKVCGEASDGLEAIEKALLLSPDLIVMDLSMPRMNGMVAAREIKQEMPLVPIILFTSHKADLSGADANEAGISAIICKSEGQGALMTEIQSLLGLSGSFVISNGRKT